MDELPKQAGGGFLIGYKVGDRVEVVKSSDFPDMVGKICKVVAVSSPNSAFACRIIEAGTGFSPLMLSHEIKPALKIGEQLLLFEL